MLSPGSFECIGPELSPFRWFGFFFILKAIDNTLVPLLGRVNSWSSRFTTSCFAKALDMNLPYVQCTFTWRGLVDAHPGVSCFVSRC